MTLPMHKRGTRIRAKLLGTAGAAMIAAVGLPNVALAQSTTTPQAPLAPTTETPDQPDKDIVVTGTRVVRNGYDAPTPTTVIGTAEIAAKAPNNLADFVNEFPALSGSTTPRTTTSGISAGNAGLNALNLRQLGANRTLVLLDGQRVGASSIGGLIDINQFPQALVKRVDVVTGGASADYGSDAVAGVVNFVLDKDFTGIKGEAQGGVTTYGDDRSYKVSLTAGTKFAGDRGHFLISAEAAHNDGIRGIGSRTWYNASKVFNNPTYTATNGEPQLFARANTGFAVATPGGIITSTALKGTYFGAGGVPLQFTYGPIVSGNYTVGGQAAYADFGTDGDLDPTLSRQNVFTRASFNITENVEVFAQLSYGRSSTHADVESPYNLGTLTIKSDNAFLPATVAARAAALGIASFTLGTLNKDFGLITNDSERESWRPVIGARGDFNALGSHWSWDVYGQKSITTSVASSSTSITANFNNAIDAVRNSSGAIVCRSTLTNPANGCVPFNIFGVGVNDQSAQGYIRGTTFLRTRLTEDVVAGNLRGDPFSTWAGPVSVAMGIEHRREGVSGSVDALDAASLATSLANNTARVSPYFAGNFLPSFGSYTVTEGYFETVVPLAKDNFLAKRLDVSGAIRATSYSTSGFLTTWKLGLNYSPVEDITFRVTRSRDVRAPNLAELFNGSSSVTTTITDPFRANASTTLFQVTSGNLALQPEKANTLGLGVVLKPRFLPGFAASVDYFRIGISQAIASIGAQVLVNQCFSGNAALCSQITRNSSNVITSIAVQPINLSQQINRGLDFEVSYRHPLLGGDLSARAVATHYLQDYTNNGINKPTDIVGTNYGGGLGATSLPNWSYLATVGWNKGPLSTLFTARGVSGGVLNTSYIECTSGCPTSTTDNMTIDNNHVAGAIYFDAYASIKVRSQAEVFFAVDNLTNKDPVQVPWMSSAGGAPLSINQALYDTLGRRFRVGFRFKM